MKQETKKKLVSRFLPAVPVAASFAGLSVSDFFSVDLSVLGSVVFVSAAASFDLSVADFRFVAVGCRDRLTE